MDQRQIREEMRENRAAGRELASTVACTKRPLEERERRLMTTILRGTCLPLLSATLARTSGASVRCGMNANGTAQRRPPDTENLSGRAQPTIFILLCHTTNQHGAKNIQEVSQQFYIESDRQSWPKAIRYWILLLKSVTPRRPFVGLIKGRIDPLYNTKISPSQCGGVPGRGADFAAHAARSTLSYASQMNWSVGMVFMDLSKAFVKIVRELVVGWQDHLLVSKVVCVNY